MRFWHWSEQILLLSFFVLSTLKIIIKIIFYNIDNLFEKLFKEFCWFTFLIIKLYSNRSYIRLSCPMQHKMSCLAPPFFETQIREVFWKTWVWSPGTPKICRLTLTKIKKIDWLLSVAHKKLHGAVQCYWAYQNSQRICCGYFYEVFWEKCAWSHEILEICG